MGETQTHALQVRQTSTESLFSPSHSPDAMAMASKLSDAKCIPDAFRGSPADCHIALDMAHRTGAPILQVMQSMYIVKGKPAWSGQFIIALINTCGRFSPLRWDYGGQGNKRHCTAHATDLASGEILRGTTITMDMVRAEKWGAKWQTMPDQMFAYRSASFWSRMFCPEVTMGMRTAEEVEDIMVSEMPPPGVIDVGIEEVTDLDRYAEAVEPVLMAFSDIGEDGVQALYARGQAMAEEFGVQRTDNLNDAYNQALARIAEDAT